MNKKNILLTGASGTVGYQVLTQLYEKKEQYSITVFDKKTKTALKKFKKFKDIQIIYGDITDEKSLKPACVNADAVIHLAAIIPPLAYDEPRLAYKVNVEGTGNLIRLLSKYSPNAFLLYSSSIAVYGDRLNKPYIKVSDPLIPAEGDEYAKTKIQAEKIIKKSGLDYRIFRLTAIMGNHKISKIMFYQPLNTPMEIATPEDTARAFVKALDFKKQLSKKIYNLGGGEACRIRYDDFLKRSFQVFGLGTNDFPKKAFAEKNFHCGYYQDSDVLEQILHYRKDNLETFFAKEKQKVQRIKKLFVFTFKKIIKKYLLKISEPYQAFTLKDKHLINHFFKT